MASFVLPALAQLALFTALIIISLCENLSHFICFTSLIHIIFCEQHNEQYKTIVFNTTGLFLILLIIVVTCSQTCYLVTVPKQFSLLAQRNYNKVLVDNVRCSYKESSGNIGETSWKSLPEQLTNQQPLKFRQLQLVPRFYWRTCISTIRLNANFICQLISPAVHR